MTDLLPYMTELFPFDNDMKSYNTTLSSYYTNDNASQRFLSFYASYIYSNIDSIHLIHMKLLLL